MSAERATASDRPGVAQPVPERPVPARPWGPLLVVVAIALVALTAVWEWRMRGLGLLPGDVDDGAGAWVEQRRRIDDEDVAVAIVGDSRILFATDLDRFATLTGARPVQLALPGTNARPFLEELARDSRFDGLVVVGITDGSYFRDGIGLMSDALDRYRFESPSQRSAYVLHGALSRTFAFLDDNYRLSALVHRLDRGWRPGTRGPYNDVWKLSTKSDDRQTRMWSRIERDPFLRAHARYVWMHNPGFVGPPVDEAVVARATAATRAAVATIRARGGEVVFLRPPSAPALRAFEDRRIPRAKGWDRLLATADVAGVHFDDDPAMQGLDIPEYSHLSRACATVYTDAYVRALARITPRIVLRADAPAALRPVDCLPATQPPVPTK